MAKILMIYGTKEGHTRKIAEAIAGELNIAGHDVDLFNARGIPRLIGPGGYDAVVVGGPVYAGHFPKALRNWVHLNAPSLSSRPAAFFSVCLGVLQVGDRSVQKEERRIMEDLFVRSGWRPTASAIFAGALPYTRYGWLKRRIMRGIVARAGGDTDTSRDYDYTDWEEVRRFARAFGKSLRQAA